MISIFMSLSMVVGRTYCITSVELQHKYILSHINPLCFSDVGNIQVIVNYLFMIYNKK